MTYTLRPKETADALEAGERAELTEELRRLRADRADRVRQYVQDKLAPTTPASSGGHVKTAEDSRWGV